MFKIVELSGTHFEMGYQHGDIMKEQILSTLLFNKNKMEKLWKRNWEEIKSYSNQFLPYLQKNHPDYIEELRGISEGSRLPFDDILAINCRYEISRKGLDKDNCCTTIGISKEKSKDGHAKLAENWDWALCQKKNIVILKMKYNNGLKITTITEAGIIGRMGINNYGIGVVGNTLKNTNVGIGIPVHFTFRKLLEQRSIDSVKEFFQDNKIASSYNFMIANESKIYDFEVDNKQAKCLQAECLYHTNHFIISDLRKNNAYTQYEAEESLKRYESVEEQIKKHKLIDYEDLIQILSSHENHPQGVCTHSKENVADDKKWSTLCSVIFDLTSKEIYLSCGNPCTEPYERMVI